MRDREKEAFLKAMHFFGIIFVFAVGAGIGGVLSGLMGCRTIWISSAILAGVAIMMAE